MQLSAAEKQNYPLASKEVGSKVGRSTAIPGIEELFQNKCVLMLIGYMLSIKLCVTHRQYLYDS